MELSPGVKLGPYEVLEPLGAGGMGQVWKARDSRLGRDVAVKIIAHEMAGDASLQMRFEREARALSALNHPNIVCVYDVGEQDGAQYIVSELVPGESLRQRISRGPLPADELLRIASQISDALSAAHAAGIVHRDLKPENIMITPDGRPKILDFGLARRLAPHASAEDPTVTLTTATQPGTVMGTAGYMSPEQICGEEVDGRSDIFSMGVVLYEMATGARAFQGRSSIEMMSAILKDDPPHLPSKVHLGLDLVIRRCLEKTRSKRFQNASELHAALESLAGDPGRSAATRGRWIGAGALAAALIIAAVYWQGTRKAAPVAVPAQVVAQAPQTPAAPPPAAAETVPPEPPRSPESPAKKVERPAANVALPPPVANDPAFQKAYEQGMLLLADRKWAPAATSLEEAVRLKPDSGAARVGLCRALGGRLNYTSAITVCSEAIRLVPNSADAYHERGAAYVLSQKFDPAVVDMNAAIRLGDTNMALAHSVRGRAHSGLNEWGAAIEDFDQAIKLNPQNPHFYLFRGMAFLPRHQNRKAIDDFDQALKLQPNLPLAYAQRAIAKQRMGDTTGAEADRGQAKALRGR